MDRTERFYKIQAMLQGRRAVSTREFLAALEISKATFRRDIDYLRDRLHAPIIYDYVLRGYRLGKEDPDGPRYELPGLWLNSSEAHALLTTHHLLANLQPGLLGPHIEPLKNRIKALLEKGDKSANEVMDRIRVLPLAARRLEPACFQVLAHALLARKRLRIVHYNRAGDKETEREVSPQRLVHYRDNWYLDCWDHGKRALRTFAADAIREAHPLDNEARDLSDEKLDAELGAGYGIFAGKRTRTARLCFTPERARWVTNEQWHPEQKGYFKDEHYILEIPYADDRELLMDILKYGAGVSVLAPKSLRNNVRHRLRQAAAQYEN